MSWYHIGIKSAVVGGVSAIAGRFVLGYTSFVAFNGWTMPFWLAMFIASDIATMFSEVAAHYIWPLLGSNKWVDPAAGWTLTVLNAFSMAGITYLENSRSLTDIGAVKILAVGAGSYLVGDYLYRFIVAPALGIEQTSGSY